MYCSTILNNKKIKNTYLDFYIIMNILFITFFVCALLRHCPYSGSFPYIYSYKSMLYDYI